MKFKVKVNNREYEVEILNADPPIFEVSVNGKKTVLNVAEKKKKDVSENVLAAEMSGTIVKVMVKEGDEVKAGQPVLILEAMKMENEVVSPVDGKVAKILVKEGDKVTQGDTVAFIR